VGDAVQAVNHNHQLMYDTLDVNREKAVTTWQVHGADVVIANGPVTGRKWLAKADGVITNRVDVPLVMRYAVCVPLLFYDPQQQAIGLAHAGWRGTVQGMAANMVFALQQAYGSQPQDIQVVIGPSISIDCFQVGEEVVDALEGYFGSSEGLMRRDPADGTAYVDLWAANQLDLQRAGVEQIEIAGICTYQNKADFFSHRAENGKTGRFGVVMSL
jgi:YfiH family protein